MPDVRAPLNALDRAIAALAPGWAMKRAQARTALAYYEAANPGRTRKGRREAGSGNVAIQRAGTALREQARHLEQNHDIAFGALNVLVQNVIGPQGIGVEPQPRTVDGDIHDAFAEELLDLHKDWCKRPEVTWQHDWASCQRILARSWFRDGEVYAQMLEGISATLNHGTTVPFSLEMLEADYLPLTLMSAGGQLATGSNATINQGVEINTWGRPVGYWVYKEHPADFPVLLSSTALKRISAENMLSVVTRYRIRQLRGVSVFATVIARLEDLKDYEESERVAAKVAASMAGYIKKGQADMYTPPASDGTDGSDLRDLRFRPGMIFDDLKPGEEIGTIDSNRPNPNLTGWRDGQLRAAASGIGVTNSSLSKNYNGTYSAQRQELVEGYASYGILSSEFAARIVVPSYERFVALAIAARKVRVPPNVRPDTIDDCLAIPPQMPWINPKDEATANAIMEDRCYRSGPEIIRRAGGNPRAVLDQQARWRRDKADRGLPDVTAVPPSSAPPEPPAD